MKNGAGMAAALRRALHVALNGVEPGSARKVGAEVVADQKLAVVVVATRLALTSAIHGYVQQISLVVGAAMVSAPVHARRVAAQAGVLAGPVPRLGAAEEDFQQLARSAQDWLKALSPR